MLFNLGLLSLSTMNVELIKYWISMPDSLIHHCKIRFLFYEETLFFLNVVTTRFSCSIFFLASVDFT
jgi:hypothetical protein